MLDILILFFLVVLLNVAFFYYYLNEVLYFWFTLDAISLAHTIIIMIRSVWRREGITNRQRIKEIINIQIRKAIVFFAIRLALYFKDYIEHKVDTEFLIKHKLIRKKTL